MGREGQDERGRQGTARKNGKESPILLAKGREKISAQPRTGTVSKKTKRKTPRKKSKWAVKKKEQELPLGTKISRERKRTPR